MRNLMNLFAIEMAIYTELMNNPLVANLYATEIETPPTRKEVISDWLENEIGLTPNNSVEEMENEDEVVVMTLSELETIKREMDILKVRAEEGEELARKLDALHSEFFPSKRAYTHLWFLFATYPFAPTA